MTLYSLIRPLLFTLDAESAHRLAIAMLKARVLLPAANPGDERLGSDVMGLHFANPVGLAAGFDKDAEVPAAALRLGFGFVEAGTVTPRPQPGNPKPRLFRLVRDRGVINRLGFNNGGLDRFAANLSRLRDVGMERAGGVVGANIGANKDSADRIADYVEGLGRVAAVADYVTVNISSPNTPGLRDLQGRAALDDLLGQLAERRDGLARETGKRTPLAVKIAPDLDEAAKQDIAEVVLARGIDALIVSNTTVTRPDTLRSPERAEAGGLSGAPLFDLSTHVLSDMYRLTEGRLPLIGVGGVENGETAYAKIRAGASLVQLYSAMVYEGPGLAGRIARELSELLRRDGFANVREAVGVDADKSR